MAGDLLFVVVYPQYHTFARLAMEKVREVWYDAYKDEGQPSAAACSWAAPADLPLIRSSATFPQGGRHHYETRSPP